MFLNNCQDQYLHFGYFCYISSSTFFLAAAATDIDPQLPFAIPNCTAAFKIGKQN